MQKGPALCKARSDNADTHPKRRLMGRAAAAARTGAQLHFAPWTCICSGGFDGRRPKGVPVKIIGQ
ncbi:hypothetical protein [Desulfobulbus oralis]|uniref:Uncharacterized protein n=1 Tax=Desulfobulbus oralis TaxID=1986146 RepID=A0A2L1GLK9_9BACT|nr:hypothetical protein [Desulfobulbus oralis]AVD70497.1 hypothetical protein CAY53_02590 [Desulfobulbus oralis]